MIFMFKPIRYRLLLSYLLILGTILGIFAIGVRFLFAHSLRQQTLEKLKTLGRGAIANIEIEHHQLRIEGDFNAQDMLNQNQSLQWFDLQGNLLAQQGKIKIDLPLSKSSLIQDQKGHPDVLVITLPILENNSRNLMGYIRVSQSLQDIQETLEKLDWGLGMGILGALVLSGIGGIILTNQAMRPIEESFKRLKQFTADASHEFRSPLMAIASNVEVSLKYPGGMRETDRESFEAIASATNQMTQLTEGLLLLARTEKNNTDQQETVNLKIVIEDLIQFYQPQFFVKNINLTSELQESLLISGNAVQLSRLFSNLIENALHYTPAEGLIEIQGKQKRDFIEIHIKDTGIGIATENLDKIFERFWRADNSRSYWDGGSGLGLSIVDAIVQNHRGRINVTSELTKGSCFTVYLPTNLNFDHPQ
jgi:signal transduction histidine kinase